MVHEDAALLNRPATHVTPPHFSTAVYTNRYSRPAMEAVLDRVLRDNSLEPPSLRAVARQIGCHMTRLVSIFPEKTHAIKTAHQNWIQSRKVDHQANIQRAVREAVLKVHATGAYPSSGRVKALLPTYADLRSAFARSVWKEALAELGYSPRDTSTQVLSDSGTETV